MSRFRVSCNPNATTAWGIDIHHFCSNEHKGIRESAVLHPDPNSPGMACEF